jgi:hypothetical protein
MRIITVVVFLASVIRRLLVGTLQEHCQMRQEIPHGNVRAAQEAE